VERFESRSDMRELGSFNNCTSERVLDVDIHFRIIFRSRPLITIHNDSDDDDDDNSDEMGTTGK